MKAVDLKKEVIVDIISYLVKVVISFQLQKEGLGEFGLTPPAPPVWRGGKRDETKSY